MTNHRLFPISCLQSQDCLVSHHCFKLNTLITSKTWFYWFYSPKNSLCCSIQFPAGNQNMEVAIRLHCNLQYHETCSQKCVQKVSNALLSIGGASEVEVCKVNKYVCSRFLEIKPAVSNALWLLNYDRPYPCKLCACIPNWSTFSSWFLAIFIIPIGIIIAKLPTWSLHHGLLHLPWSSRNLKPQLWILTRLLDTSLRATPAPVSKVQILLCQLYKMSYCGYASKKGLHIRSGELVHSRE